MIAVLCCGACFDEKALLEEGSLYVFLDELLSAKEEKVGISFSHLSTFIENITQLFDMILITEFTMKLVLVDIDISNISDCIFFFFCSINKPMSFVTINCCIS